MKIVVLDGYCLNPGDLSWEGFAAMGEMTVYDRTPLEDEEEIARRIAGAEVVLTNKTPLSRAVISGSKSLRYIGVLATGYNVVDIDAAGELGIPVCNVPAYGTSAVAQFAIALLLEICHHVGGHDQAVHEGAWSRCSDVVSLHCPLTPDTKGIIDRKAISMMKEGAILINNSRGPLIVEQDVADALNSGRLLAAGVDVADTEPLSPDSPLLTAKNCIITPHISWAPRETRRRLMDIAVENLRAFLDGRTMNVVNNRNGSTK